MPSDILPGYTYNESTRRYRNLATGRFVPRRAIVEQLGRVVEENRARIADLTMAAHERSLSLPAWQEQTRQALKRMHSQYAALGVGGWDNMTPRDWGRIGAALRDDYARIARLARDIEQGVVTLPQALQRVNGYMGNARAQYYKSEATRLRPSRAGGVIISRRILGASEHCDDCLDYYARGWQNLGVLPVPTQGSSCGTFCACDIVHREIDGGEAEQWIGTKRS